MIRLSTDSDFYFDHFILLTILPFLPNSPALFPGGNKVVSALVLQLKHIHCETSFILNETFFVQMFLTSS